MIVGTKKSPCQDRCPGPATSRVPPALILAALCLLGCSPRGAPLPPSAPPLSRDILGYAVVGAAYTRIMSEPGGNGVALGYARERTILRVLERRLVRSGDERSRWVFVEGDYQGWLPEEVVMIYDNEDKAKTAAKGP